MREQRDPRESNSLSKVMRAVLLDDEVWPAERRFTDSRASEDLNWWIIASLDLPGIHYRAMETDLIDDLASWLLVSLETGTSISKRDVDVFIVDEMTKMRDRGTRELIETIRKLGLAGEMVGPCAVDDLAKELRQILSDCLRPRVTDLVTRWTKAGHFKHSARLRAESRRTQRERSDRRRDYADSKFQPPTEPRS